MEDFGKPLSSRVSTGASSTELRVRSRLPKSDNSHFPIMCHLCVGVVLLFDRLETNPPPPNTSHTFLPWLFGPASAVAFFSVLLLRQRRQLRSVADSDYADDAFNPPGELSRPTARCDCFPIWQHLGGKSWEAGHWVSSPRAITPLVFNE